MTNPLNLPPNLLQLTEYQGEAFHDFFEATNPNTISSYASGSNLKDLIDAAEKVTLAFFGYGLANPIPQDRVSLRRQWATNHLSEVKQRVAQAIEHKRAYYEHHIFGMITKYVLKLFCQWNNGDTSAIMKAENFLLYYDSRLSVIPITNPHSSAYGSYTPSGHDFFLREVDLSQFYNYNPHRQIEVVHSSGHTVNFANARAAVDSNSRIVLDSTTVRA